MYLMDSFCAESSAGRVMNDAHKTTRSMQELEASRIRCAAESVCLYRLRRAEVNGPRWLFRATRRQAKRVLLTILAVKPRRFRPGAEGLLLLGIRHTNI